MNSSDIQIRRFFQRPSHCFVRQIFQKFHPVFLRRLLSKFVMNRLFSAITIEKMLFFCINTLSLTLFSSWRAILISSSVHRSSIGIVFLIGLIWTRFSGRGGTDFVRIEDGLFAVSSRFEFRVILRSGSGSDSSRSEFRVTLRSTVSDGAISRINHKFYSNEVKSYQVDHRTLLENDFLYLNHLMRHFLYR